MLNKQKTREEGKNFAGSKTGHLINIRCKKDNSSPSVYQGKCFRCPYFPGMGYACNLVPCPFSGPCRCGDCACLLPVNEHRGKRNTS